VGNNSITLVPQQGAFIVNGQKGKYCVTLFPKETDFGVDASFIFWRVGLSLLTVDGVFITFCFKGVFRVKAESGAGSKS
jgi:hypothetical protein